MGVHDPVGHVDLVAGLLHQVIAAEPAEEVPIADLVLHLAHLRRPERARPRAAGIIIRPHEPYLANRAVADLLDLLQVQRLVPPLQADHHGETFRLGNLVGGQQLPITGGIDTAGLLQEDVPSRLDGSRVMDGPKMGRRGEQHQVDARVDHLLVGLETHETPLRRDVDAGTDLLVIQQVLEADLQAAGNQIAHGN